MPETAYLAAMTLISGALVFAFVGILIATAARRYRESFVSRVDMGLKDSFIFLDPALLFMLNVTALPLGGGLGYLLLGPTGAVLMVLAVGISPSVALYLLKKKRTEAFISQLPDCLNSIAAALRAGSNLARAMEQVATQNPPPLSQEFAIVLSEYSVGRKLEDSLHDVYARVKRPEVDLMNSAITISRAVGGNLADTLDSLSETLREKAQVEGRIMALTAMGRMQGWVSCLLPAGVGLAMYKQDPQSMKPLFNEPLGWLVIALITAMIIPAVWMIRKIVNIDV